MGQNTVPSTHFEIGSREGKTSFSVEDCVFTEQKFVLLCIDI